MRRGSAVALIFVSGACGRLDFATTARDASPDTPVDACTFTPFGAPRALTELNNKPATDYGGQISADGLTYYFDSDRGSSQDIYVAHRASRTQPFDPPQRIDELDTQAMDSDATVTADQLEMFFFSNRDMKNCIYTSHRLATDASWDPPTQLVALCTGGIGGPFVTLDGLTLVYNTLDDGAGEGKLMVSHRASRDDTFVTGDAITELLSGATKGYPALSSDELTIYYESTGGGVHLQIWQATRDTPGSPLGTPALVPGADDGDASNEGDVSITADGLELFFASDHTGDNDLYVSTRACE